MLGPSLIPVSFTGWLTDSAHGRKDKRTADSKPISDLLIWHMAVDNLNQAKGSYQIKQVGYQSMRVTFDIVRSCSFLKPLQEVFSSAEMLQDNRGRLSNDPSGFDYGPVFPAS